MQKALLASWYFTVVVDSQLCDWIPLQDILVPNKQPSRAPLDFLKPLFLFAILPTPKSHT